MKTILSFFIALSFTFLFAQEYIPLSNPENRWIVMHVEESEDDDYPYYVKYRLNPENTITYNDKQYISVEWKWRYSNQWGHLNPWGEWGDSKIYISENTEEKKVYVYYDNFESPYGGILTGEFLLYDFDLEIDDSIPTDGFINSETVFEPVYVSSIEYQNVFGYENVKTYITDFYNLYIYEGIGSSYGLFTLNEFHTKSYLDSFYQTPSDYTPLIQEENGWEFSYNEWDSTNGQMIYNDYQAKLSGEQINYNDKVYQAIQMRSRERIEETPQTDWTEWETEFYLSENIDQRKVYIYYPDETLFHHPAGEFLLYDFNLEEGDVMNLDGFNETNGNSEAVILAVSNETVFGIDNVRTYHLAADEFEFKVYEGIGASTGLITMSFIIDAGWTLTNYGILSNQEFQTKQIKIYPNPFKDKIQIENPEEITEFQLYTLDGKLISTHKNVDDLNSKLSSLNNAVYFLKVKSENNKSQTVKLIKNK